jgi:HSP20 family protein
LAIVRWSPSNDLASLHSAMDRLFGDVFGEMFGPGERPEQRAVPEGTGQLPTYFLPVNIAETEKGYRIEAPVPGFRPENVEITFADGVLSINARRTDEKERKEGNYLRREVAFGSYRRQITLPGDIRSEDIKASFDNGVLTIEVPRAPRPQPKRIEVRAEEKQLTGAGSKKS